MARIPFLVTVRPLEGAGLATYRELERRIDATEPEWDIRIEPPLRALPPIPFDEEGELTGEGRSALGLTIWAQRRIGVPVRLSGTQAQIDAVRDVLEQTAVDYEAEASETDTGAIETAWAIPES